MILHYGGDYQKILSLSNMWGKSLPRKVILPAKRGKNASYCQLLPVTDSYCQLRPVTSINCHLLPVTARYCLLLPVMGSYFRYCHFLPVTSISCQLLPFPASYWPLLQMSKGNSSGWEDPQSAIQSALRLDSLTV